MKNRIMIVILFSLMLGSVFLSQSCDEQKIEILPDLNELYKKNPEEAAVITLSDEEFDSLFTAAVGNAAAIPDFASHLFINEKGEIEKMKLYLIDSAGTIQADTENRLTPTREFFAGLPVIPAVDEGKPVASQLVFISFTDSAEKNRLYKTGNLKGKREFADVVKMLQGLHGSNNDNEFFVAVEQMPMPIGGIQAIAEKIVYPEEAKINGIEGKVFVRAFINEEGIVERAEVIKGIGAGCDEAAIDAVTKTKFKPGMQKGVPVKVQVSIPIVFKLN